MKTQHIVSVCASNFLLVCATWGQASFELANLHTPVVDAPVFDAHGNPLSGSEFLAELWGSASADSLTPLVDVSQGNGRVFAPFLSPGYFASGNSHLSVNSVPPGGWAWLQVRVWDLRLGPTYEDVVAMGIGGYGESPTFYAQGGNPYDLLGLAPPLIGLQSFSLLPVVPEPSEALLALSGMVLWWGVRQHQPRKA